MICPICTSSQSHLIPLQRRRKENRRFSRCTNCTAVWEDPSSWLSERDEKARYLLHQNHPEDSPYREYLEGILRQVWEGITYVSQKSPSGQRLDILDYGCGPVPVVAPLLSHHGHRVTSYDPYFAPITLQGLYDLILCIEVAEHFKEPRKEFIQMARLLKEGGFLAIHTHRVPEKDEDFAGWWYKEDTTHRVFYSGAAMEALSSCMGVSLVGQPEENLWLFQRPFRS
ncbi:MAG TPA: class I SAM-dependent methyltransferase [Termitinemataceae bacterium]|nr:class I SAM-dependent methyltransferase [Termitinemataceae bacterium]HOM24551.1 class I SAM-dependent methyltransferase [Termitinemataceae bacterium]HPQ01658.1 class I SAM-dependent methyltransferase [Termitinemataceae bacterium]